MLNQQVDCAKEFEKLENWYFTADCLSDFDPNTAAGHVVFRRHTRKVRLSFNDVTTPLERAQSWVFPPESREDMEVWFRLEFQPDSIRFRLQLEPDTQPARGKVWDFTEEDGRYIYTDGERSIAVERSPFRVSLRDAAGRVLVQTNNMADAACLHKDRPFPLGLVRNMESWQCRFASSLSLFPGEKIFGGGRALPGWTSGGRGLCSIPGTPMAQSLKGCTSPSRFS